VLKEILMAIVKQKKKRGEGMEGICTPLVMSLADILAISAFENFEINEMQTYTWL
jgi:hypothetical protein